MNENKTENVEAVGDCLLNIVALGRVIGMSPLAIRVALCRGRFPLTPIKLGNRLRWRASDLRAWMQAAGDQATGTTPACR